MNFCIPFVPILLSIRLTAFPEFLDQAEPNQDALFPRNYARLNVRFLGVLEDDRKRCS